MASEPVSLSSDAAAAALPAAPTTGVLGTPRRAPAARPASEPTPVAAVVAHLAPHAAAEGVEVAAGKVRFLNRELSRLDYYARVLSNAGNQSFPLLERARFVAFFSSYLDELFQVQVAGLKDQVAAGMNPTYPDGLSPVDQLRLIGDRVDELVGRQSELFVDDLGPALAAPGIRFSGLAELSRRPRLPRRGVRAARVPGAHAARR